MLGLANLGTPRAVRSNMRLASHRPLIWPQQVVHEICLRAITFPETAWNLASQWFVHAQLTCVRRARVQLSSVWTSCCESPATTTPQECSPSTVIHPTPSDAHTCHVRAALPLAPACRGLAHLSEESMTPPRSEMTAHPSPVRFKRSLCDMTTPLAMNTISSSNLRTAARSPGLLQSLPLERRIEML